MNHIEQGLNQLYYTAFALQTDGRLIAPNEDLNDYYDGYSADGQSLNAICAYTAIASSLLNSPVSELGITPARFNLYEFNVGGYGSPRWGQLYVDENSVLCFRTGDPQGNAWGAWGIVYAPIQENVYDMESGWTANTSGKNYVSRQGKRCVLAVSAKYTSAMSPSTGTLLTTLDVEYRPKYTAYGILYGYHTSSPTIDRIAVSTNGTVQIQGTTAANTSITGMIVYDVD
jgi:hypothetical protein